MKLKILTLFLSLPMRADSHLFDPNDGIIKQSEDVMKNKIIILALLVTAGIVGNAFANPTDDSHYPVKSNSSAAVYFGHSYPNS